MEPAVESKTNILVAMSGGVDSSLVGAMLAAEGHDVVGVNMRTHRLSPGEIALGARIKTCCSPVDAKDARCCADRGNFPFYVIDVEPAFERDVVDPFIRAYMGGRTPNPCVLCNNHVKLGLLLEKAKLYGCDLVATGHYAIKERHPETGRWTMRRAADRNKDQTYYLYGLTQEQLAVIVFPLGEMTKDDVRRRARELALPTADKPESQEICFIPDNDYRGFLRRRFADRGVEMPRGKIVDTRGNVLGEHEGVAFYTVGQRRGIGIAAAEPLYVVHIDRESNIVVVGPRDALMCDAMEVDGLNWMGIAGIDGPIRARVQIRYRHEPAWATVERGDNADAVRVRFDEPVRAISPGQATVFFDGQDRVLGGGWIVRSLAGEACTEPARRS